MKTTIKLVSILTWGSLLFSNPAQALNLKFDNSWEKFGDVEVVNPTTANLSTDGLFDDDFDLGANNGDFNYSGNPAGTVGFGGLEDFLGVDVSIFDIDGVAYEGSAIQKTINVKAGDKLKFAWNFSTNETSQVISQNVETFRGSFLDYGFFLVNGQITKLADINSTTTSSTNNFDRQTGIQSYEYKFNNAGAYTIALGVIDINDFSMTSALSLNNISLETSQSVSVPEPLPQPLTILGSGLVLGFVNLSKKKHPYQR
ncbi:PEP-CTERM sorting domain-containing protein [Plectonema cf. radiosum LEGE 06105]|uniref:PEP-CTERM sorting domain-containing protein n=1 Tax=Plectonema cf. radiosum LEGE 06105 TaxID=945769 RepID=A0A8J7JZX4_9CYAN|nr:PEP-CTERM sorting domain-containing protein [Plectonema radiosum]MBE9213001.1 PEP-CTERM sorting domain-containing protein [Plectonema cf. radiosum LEGE 06105]